MAYPTDSWERAMAARLCAGDDSAMGPVYIQYGPMVYGIAIHLVGADDAADVCQDVFASLWSRPGRFDPDRGTLRTYLAVMTRRRGIDALRRSGRRRVREERFVSATVGIHQPDVEEAAAALIAADQIRRALGRLPPNQAAAVQLAYFYGLSDHAVAAAMGSPDGTAKSRLRLGLGHLARDLNNLSPERDTDDRNSRPRLR